eukprot:TRINITY_DN3610_c0_g1_i4.p1 TRINITY_DN3610_c0_g1~~TRINITY_DN3610_c0_g1_i4.p1  ORF type:complete len:276 (-),score=76.82 TRINITY_DN3610_c0_g1_i4:42-869(-)
MERGLECKWHEGEKLWLFCRKDTCNMKVCKLCIKNQHRGHHIENLIQASGALNERRKKRGVERKMVGNEMKAVLSELEGIEKKVAEKSSKLHLERKKYEEQFETRLRKWITIVKEKSVKLEKHIVRFKEKVLLIKKDQSKSHEHEKPINLLQCTDDYIRKYFQMQKEYTPQSTIGDLKVELQSLIKEFLHFEQIAPSMLQDGLFINSGGNIVSKPRKDMNASFEINSETLLFNKSLDLSTLTNKISLNIARENSILNNYETVSYTHLTLPTTPYV